VFDAFQFAASTPPWSLLIVPLIWISIFGTRYDPKPVARVTSPGSAWQNGLVELDGGRREVYQPPSMTTEPTECTEKVLMVSVISVISVVNRLER
jgi:hypothetical protein